MPKHDVARPALIVIDAQTSGNNFQILNPPIPRIASHFGDELRRVRHDYMVSPVVPHTRFAEGCRRRFPQYQRSYEELLNRSTSERGAARLLDAETRPRGVAIPGHRHESTRSTAVSPAGVPAPLQRYLLVGAPNLFRRVDGRAPIG